MKKTICHMIGYALLLVLSVVLLFLMCHNSNQAAAAFPLKATFQGEYKIEDGEWNPIVKGQKISAMDGDVTLKGYFQLECDDGEVLGKVQQGCEIAMYFDHIEGEVFINGESCHIFDVEQPMIGKSTCGEHWFYLACPAAETDTVEIVLKNPHQFGNYNAVNEFLDSMYLYSGKSFENMMLDYGLAERTVGFAIIVVSLILIGVAAFSTMLKISQSTLLWLFGLMTFFAGSFFVLSSPNICLWNEFVAFNTTAKQLCMILYPFFMFALITKFVNEKCRKISCGIVALSGITACAMLVIAIFSNMLIYDLVFYWLVLQIPLTIVLLVCCILSYKDAPKGLSVILTVCLLSLVALDVDISAEFLGWWQNALLSKAVFILIFASALVLSFKIIPTSIRASIRKNELELELQQNKIAILLSQIQPHFLNNALSAICDLCCRNPHKAREALVDFSVYLRGNMNTLSSNKPVAFSTELSHIEAYLKLEKLRFGDKLNVVYDIEEENFFIPSLTVQPLVENAVQHGICKSEKPGTLTIHTCRNEDTITIIVDDDGVGFDVHEATEDTGTHTHLGLQNVKQRIEHIAGGKLTIESTPGKGTTATIQFCV